MFDTLPDAVEYARKLVGDGRATRADPCQVGWVKEGSKIVWWVVPATWTRVPDGFVSQQLFPEWEM